MFVFLRSLVLSATILFASAAAHAAVTFEATLSGGQEVPPNASTASGFATLTLNDAQDRLEFMLTLAGLDLDGAQTADPNDDIAGIHIHAAPAGSRSVPRTYRAR